MEISLQKYQYKSKIGQYRIEKKAGFHGILIHQFSENKTLYCFNENKKLCNTRWRQQ
jgi:hypothetical protein